MSDIRGRNKIAVILNDDEKPESTLPYIKFIKSIGKYNVWIVDGKYIRKNIDEDFTNFGQHYRFAFIPLNEFWIDIENTSGEISYFIDHLIMEHKLMDQGFSYNAALEIADQVEKNERYKSEKFKKYENVKNYDEKVKDVKKELLGNRNGFDIWLIDGELVRDWFYIDFTAGGHHLVYPWIPYNEIWIDDDIEEVEVPFVLLHEYVERNFMSNGDSYSIAHNKSLKIELDARRNN